MTVATDVSTADQADPLEHFGAFAVFGMAAAALFSIAAAQILLTIGVACWVGLIIVREERVAVPRFFWPLLAYAGITLLSAALSPEPRVSFADSKQLVLFLVVPLVYRFITGSRGATMVTVLVTFGAASAAFGIFQYGILHYDHLGQRPQGTLSHYMTFSGLLMLVLGSALARVLFGARDRLWAALVMPALGVAVALTFTRSAVVGACLAAALLLLLKDFRLIALLPVVAAIFFAVAPTTLTQRFASMFDFNDPTRRDRFAMVRGGERMIRAHPLAGVGPNRVERVYAEYRVPDAVKTETAHLHNVPVQIAAERGLPALGVWLWFIATVVVDLTRSFRRGSHPFLAAGGIAAVAAMLAAGMFEYNFGDSEFLMLFLVLITLPLSVDRSAAA